MSVSVDMRLLLIVLYSLGYSVQFKVPFQRLYPEKKEEEIVDSYAFNYITISVALGTPPQEFPFLLETNSNGFWVISHDASQKTPNQKGFKYTDSNSYKNISEPEGYYNHQVNRGQSSSEKLTIGNKQINDIHFIQASSFYELPVGSGMIGLNLKENDEDNGIDDTNIIRQLKKKDEITSYAYSFKYTSDEKGEFIFGELPHLTDPSLNNKLLKWEKTLISGSSIIWGYSFDASYSGASIIQSKDASALFGIEFGVIVAPFIYHKTERQFFAPLLLSKKCEEKYVFGFYIGYICDDDISLKNFEDLSFTKGPHTFALTKDDLFIKAHNKYICLVISPRQNFGSNTSEWIFGLPFFKKYQLVFDQDKKMIGFYVDSQVKDPRTSLGLWWIPIVLGALVMLVVSYFIYLKCRVRGVKIKQYESIDYGYTLAK